ncbi:hypothetical protein PQR46_00755 [Paraburkholderia sediminicola]|jgi:hypothetical protein|uniref:hypothetical protein n=1 Tax=Paraburkholderia TaxID=1822464 RepID=UPI0038B822E0
MNTSLALLTLDTICVSNPMYVQMRSRLAAGNCRELLLIGSSLSRDITRASRNIDWLFDVGIR